MENSLPPGPTVRYVRSRVANACDGCKRRKVRCDGETPCGYCAARRRSETCRYSPRRRRRMNGEGQQVVSLAPAQMLGGASPGPTPTSTPTQATVSRATTGAHGGAVEDDTEVPREARLLRDAHGKLTFIGDCAPLSFFQSVRRLVMTKVGQSALAPHTSGFSVLENAPARAGTVGQGSGFPGVRLAERDVAHAVGAYVCTTTSLVDLFESNERLLKDLLLWARQQQQQQQQQQANEAASVIYCLVLAIGLQARDEELAQGFFRFARDEAYMRLSDNLGVDTVQAFILITIYMLCSCQINGAFLFFGIAVRAAYSIGLHRAEVNARFGPQGARQRDRLWKSLRVVDLFLSSAMGRPPATSDEDCTVAYRTLGEDGSSEVFDLLDASVQILRIVESVVIEIYSCRKISLQLTEGISLQLREWSSRWLRRLRDVILQCQGQGQWHTWGHHNEAQVMGACQVLSSYYYAVMLVSRPFLMYELCRRLAEDSLYQPSVSGCRSTLTSGKSRLADACMDAASLMVEPILRLMERGAFRGKTPLLVSWLFASSLVLGLGLLGGFGRVLEKYTKMAIRALDFLAENDAHARQYSLIAQSLLTTALEHLERQEMRERWQRTETSSQLFGMVVNDEEGVPPAWESPMRKYVRGRQDPTAQSQNNYRDESPQQQQQQQQQRRGQQQQEEEGAEMEADLEELGPEGGGGGEWKEEEDGQGDLPRASYAHCLGEIDAAALGLEEVMTQSSDDAYWNGLASHGWGELSSAMNLFPLLEAGGGIDLAHWFGGGEGP